MTEAESNLDALKTAASSGNIDPLAVTSDMSPGRRRSSVEWYKNQLTFKLRIRDPLITKQSEYTNYRKHPCISQTFFHQIEAKNQGCGLSTDTSVFGVLINLHKTS